MGSTARVAEFEDAMADDRRQASRTDSRCHSCGFSPFLQQPKVIITAVLFFVHNSMADIVIVTKSVSSNKLVLTRSIIYTHVAAVVLTPLTTYPHTRAELVRIPVKG